MKAYGQQIPDKLYFRIGEVSDIVGVKPYVLRYWESEFGDINPTKSKSGQRLYKRRDVELLMAIKRLLYEERFTINGARKRLKEIGRTEHSTEVSVAPKANTSESVMDNSPEQLEVFSSPREPASHTAAGEIAKSTTTDNRKVFLKIKKDLQQLLQDLK